MACTLTLTRFGPSLVSNSVSAATSLSSSLSMCSASRRGGPGGNISVTRRPRKCPVGARRNFSPAAEKFLRAPAGHFLGRRVTEIFPPGHPLRDALHIESDELSEVAAETELETSEGPKRVSVSVQAIQEAGE